MKLSEMKSAEHVLAEQLKDPAFREEWERTALARAVAARVVAYRTREGLSQAALARKMGVSQPLIARLELGEHEPTLTTLTRLSRCLGLEFHIDIAPNSLQITA
ncbi:MAG TPA: helix-turn-helix domain-containing protein [Chloroflexota bacterium]|nr:helix-turn-helix domain-containing protein [Chloroflexota bacterium]